MPVAEPKPKICPQGHRFYKSSDCPTCPVCEAAKKPTAGFMSGLSAPACRALLANGIDTVEKLAAHTEKEILSFHGMGKSSIPKLKEALKKEGLNFKQ